MRGENSQDTAELSNEAHLLIFLSTQAWFPTPTSGGSPVSVTPAPGDPTPLAPQAPALMCTYPHVYTKFVLLIIIKIKLKLKK